MSLAGRIESFPLPEVLRLLARSEKSGCLQVSGGQVEGKLYLTDGTLTYGTTRQDESIAADVVASGLVSEEQWLEVERREKTIAEVLAGSKSEADLAQFLRELVTDVVFRLSRDPDGEFEFTDEQASPYDTGKHIDIDEVLAETDVRVEQWRDIESVIPGVGFRLRMARELTGQRDVTVTDEAWRALAGLDGVGSIADVAARLGSNEFQVGKVLADLARDGLLELMDDEMTDSSYYYYGDEEIPDQPEASPEPDEARSEGEAEPEGAEGRPVLFGRRKSIDSLRPEKD